MIIRPSGPEDLDALLALARKTGVGVTTFKPDPVQLAARIERSQKTLQGIAPPHEQGYLFVLEDTVSRQVVGVSAIEVALGLQEPWYNFRVGTLVHTSRQQKIHTEVPTLFLSNDHTGYSELCTLFLDPEWRHSRNGSLLSKSRLMFMALFRQKFARKVVAEMRGFSDENGHSPFWDGLGRHFFDMDFADADGLSGVGDKTFIAELMPRHPIYVPLLSGEARAAIAQVHEHTVAARAMLEQEGLNYEGYIDIFDGGPTLEAYVDNLRIAREIQQREVVAHGNPDGASLHLVCNGRDSDFRVIIAAADASDSICLPEAAAAALLLHPGDPVYTATLKPTQSRAASGRSASFGGTGLRNAVSRAVVN